jgi:hypothetical protein
MGLALVLHERFQKLPPFTLRLAVFASYHTCNWRTFSMTADKSPVLLVLVDIEQSHNFGGRFPSSRSADFPSSRSYDMAISRKKHFFKRAL